MKTLVSMVVISVLVIGVLVAVSPGSAEARHRGPAVGFSVVVPPFGFSIGTPAPYDYYYYDTAPVYVAPPYPLYERSYYTPYYGPYYGGHRHWRGEWDRHRQDRRHWRY